VIAGLIAGAALAANAAPAPAPLCPALAAAVGIRTRLADGGAVALTFDDGPHPRGTPAVLEALATAGATATFFLAGEQLLTHHELGGEIARRGHAVGLHCFHHEAYDRLAADEVRDDLQRGLDAIEAATGERPRLFRPPYGRMGDAAHTAVEELGLELVYWSAWGYDWEALGADRIADLVHRDLTTGLIVLLHDSPRYGHRPSAAPTAEALPTILEDAAARGLAIRRLPPGSP
jgi:peptidoglycan/xylan/chitin deacetylase (PgdA/CDA1 family)